MNKKLYLIVFLTSLATLGLEISLTRIFSVTMWYHYAFMAISVAMFGMSTGAVKVFVSGYNKRSDSEVENIITKYSCRFSMAVLGSIIFLLSIPFIPRFTGVGIFTVLLIYLSAAVPFYFSGVIVSLILATKYIRHVNKLYASDLAGAAAGAIVFYFFLSNTDAVSFIFLIGAAGFFGAWYLSRKKMYLIGVSCVLILVVFNHFTTFFRVEWNKVHTAQKNAKIETDIEWETWTPFSRITVQPYSKKAFGWGNSSVFNEKYPDYEVSQKNLVIDAAAASIITGKEKKVENLHHLKYDITNIAHMIVQDADIAVIGVGGGRDILASHYFNQKSVWGIEINEKILEAVTEEFSDFTYSFEKYDNVHLIHDEARSYIERHDRKYDMIQASLIDSWAATASGAFVLTENSLYTVEGWNSFFDHLTEDGIVTMSRWYYRKRPGEMLRLTNLAVETLLRRGVSEPDKHILLAATLYSGDEVPEAPEGEEFGTGTILVSRSPFTEEKIDRFIDVCEEMNFSVLLAGGHEENSLFTHITDMEKRKTMLENYPLNLSAPTDDSPFFFNMLRPFSIFSYKGIDEQGPLVTNLKAVKNLLILLGMVVLLSGLLIILPLWLNLEHKSLDTVFNPHTLYFAAIGLGFMLIEIAFMQKFTVFLGHPTYSILAVLTTVLVGSGAGSFFSSKLSEKITTTGVFLLLIGVIALTGSVNMFVFPHLKGFSLFLRLVYTVFVMFVSGFMLGMPFPMGMASLKGKRKKAAAWFWGINGAMSVTSSVIATCISIFFGISTAFFTGVFMYCLAFVAWLLISSSIKGKTEVASE